MATYARTIAREPGGKTKAGAWHDVERGKTLCATDVSARETGTRNVRSETTDHEPPPEDRRCRLCSLARERRAHPAAKPPSFDR